MNDMPKAYQGEQPFIFISYAHKDSEKVFSIIFALQNAGYNVWYDDGIEVGSEWAKTLADKIISAPIMLAFISKNYLISKNCKDEIELARNKDKNIITVFLEEVNLPSEFELRYSRYQSLFAHKYLNSEEFYQALTSAKILKDALNTLPQISTKQTATQKNYANKTNISEIKTEKINELYERALIALEDDDFNLAKAIAEKISNINSLCVELYVIRLLVDLHLKSISELEKYDKELSDNVNYKKATNSEILTIKKTDDIIQYSTIFVNLDLCAQMQIANMCATFNEAEILYDKEEYDSALKKYCSVTDMFNNFVGITFSDKAYLFHDFKATSRNLDSKNVYITDSLFSFHLLSARKAYLSKNYINALNSCKKADDLINPETCIVKPSDKKKEYIRSNRFQAKIKVLNDLMINIQKNISYEKAIELYNNNSLQEALEIFESLGDFIDTYEYIYQIAQQYINLCQYEKATKIFKNINDYKDSKQLRKKYNQILNYEKAYELYSNGKYKSAMNLFAVCEDYAESKKFIAKCEKALLDEHYKEPYTLALSYYTGGYYEKAIDTLKALEDYPPSKELIEKCNEALDKKAKLELSYENAIKLYNADNFELALTEFEKIKEYRYAKEYYEKCLTKINAPKIYSDAVNCFKNSNFEKALELFKSVENYSDSKELIKKCNESIEDKKAKLQLLYENAIKLYNAENFELALTEFEKIREYRYANDYINKCLTKINASKVQTKAVNCFKNSNFEKAKKPSLFDGKLAKQDKKNAQMVQKIIMESRPSVQERRKKGLCQYCGGSFKGVFIKVCSVCGKKKDY